MSKISTLESLCKGSITIDINDHRSCYETINQYLGEDIDIVNKTTLEEMVKRERSVRIQCYPRTPVSFFVFYHYDIDMALDIAIDEVRKSIKSQL
jgi:hypothetical protein